MPSAVWWRRWPPTVGKGFAGVIVALVLGSSCSGGGSSSPATTFPTLPPPPGTTVNADGGTTRPTGRRVNVPGSIKSDCSKDVTAPLLKWIASVPDNSTLVLGKAACYRVNGTLEVTHRSNLLIEGNGARIDATTTGPLHRSHLRLIECDNIIIRNLVVHGAHPIAGRSQRAYYPSLEEQHAFELRGVHRVLLDGVQGYDVYGDFVEIAASGTRDAPQPSDQVAVIRSRFARSGRQGVSLTDARNVDLIGNVIIDAALSLFDLEPNGTLQQVRNVRIEDNTTGAAKDFWLADYGGGNDVGDVSVRDNTMQAPTGGLVTVSGHAGGARGPYSFEGNRLRGDGRLSANRALLFANAERITIVNNDIVLPAQRNGALVQLVACSHVVISGNHYEGLPRLVVSDPATSDVQAS